MTLGHFIKTVNCSKVEAKVTAEIKDLTFGTDMSDSGDSNKRFSVWLKRKGSKNRGTVLAKPELDGSICIFDEDITFGVTLYQQECSGTFQRKRFQVVVMYVEKDSPSIPKEYGWCDIDVSHPSGNVRMPLRSGMGYIDAHIALSIDITVKRSRYSRS
jgi:hypothetical protein